METFGGLGERLVRDLMEAGEYRSNKLSAAEYDECTRTKEIYGWVSL